MRTALLFAVVVVAFPVIAPAQGVPSGALREGTLANAKLIADAKVGVAAKVATMGCSQPDSVEFFVVAMPQGAAGQRHWTELWVVSGCEGKYPVKIEFYEDGPAAANWTIAK